MSDADLIGAVADYYTGRLTEHGATPQGVDWNGEDGQLERFSQLLAVLGPEPGAYSINDYGCGYGALIGLLAARGDDFSYRGFDVSEAMVEEARRLHAGEQRARFTADRAALEPADFTVASGILNVRLDVPEERWETYVLETIAELAAVSVKGFSFNALTSHSDPDRKRPDLHYADPAALLDHCLRTYSRDVALRHDYALYEFTVVVRLDGRPPVTPPQEGTS